MPQTDAAGAAPAPASPRTHLYRHAELTPLLAPRSVVLVGASPRAGSFGARTLAYLRSGGYAGKVWLVNPQYEDIDGEACHASVGALPEAPDCAIVAVARERVQAVLEDCAQAGVKAALIYASGYAETDAAADRAQQDALRQLAQRANMRIVGPNCIGFANAAAGARLSFSEFPMRYEVGAPAIGIVSQSGALAMALAQSAEQGVAVSHALACGNACDVDVADYIAYLAEDPACRAIVCVFEGHENPARLVQAIRLARQAGKATVVHKVGASTQGQVSALRHTASVAGDAEVWRARLRDAGALVLDHFEHLVETAAFFAKAPSPKGDGAAVLSTSGGACIMSADAAARHGVPLPQPDAPALAVLEAAIPAFGYSRNPCDVTAQVISDPASFNACADALMRDGSFAAVVMPQIQAYELATPRTSALGELAALHGKIACNVWLTQWSAGPGALEAARSHHVALFRSLDNCFATLAHWQTWHAARSTA